MKYYKQNNEVFAYELDGSQDPLIGNKEPMTDEEVERFKNPPKTEAQIEAEQLAQAKEDRKALMLQGKPYTLNSKEYQISFTKDDGDGIVQVQIGFSLGLPSTIIHFDSGAEVPITADEFLPFALWFVENRNSFFGTVVEEVQEEIV